MILKYPSNQWTVQVQIDDLFLENASTKRHFHYMWGIKADHLKSKSAAEGSDRKSRRGRMRRAARETQYKSIQGKNVYPPKRWMFL